MNFEERHSNSSQGSYADFYTSRFLQEVRGNQATRQKELQNRTSFMKPHRLERFARAKRGTETQELLAQSMVRPFQEI